MKAGDVVIIRQGIGTKTLWEGETGLIVRQVLNEEFIAVPEDGPFEKEHYTDTVKGVWYEVLIDGQLKKMREDYVEPLVTRCPPDMKGIEQ